MFKIHYALPVQIFYWFRESEMIHKVALLIQYMHIMQYMASVIGFSIIKPLHTWANLCFLQADTNLNMHQSVTASLHPLINLRLRPYWLKEVQSLLLPHIFSTHFYRVKRNTLLVLVLMFLCHPGKAFYLINAEVLETTGNIKGKKNTATISSHLPVIWP